MPPRSWAKTWFCGSLMALIPVIGGALAITYVYTRKHPEDFDPGEAFLAWCILLLNLIIFLAVIIAIGAGVYFGYYALLGEPTPPPAIRRVSG